TEHLRVLLESVVARPSAKLSELALMGAQERQQVLVAWNDTRGDVSGDVTFPTLFEAQVRRAPGSEALVFEDTSLTYAQLDARANQLAHHLRTLGVGPEVRVALCVERSLDLAVAMLGIQKAGGAFVPLDPSYPRDRLSFMLEDSGAPVLVTQDSLHQQLPTDGLRVVCMDREAAHLQTLPSDSAPASSANADTLAYVIYTSGSTGRPKGTLLPHRGLNNTARQAAAAKGLGTGRRALQYAASSFDASVWEVFSTLVSGATLVLAPRDRLLPDEPLRTLLKSQRITTVTLTPSVLAQLDTAGLDALSTVVSAGEALSVELARKWGQGRTLINAYGPTETTVCATLTHGGAKAERLTIGKPLANVRVYVLDALHHPAPVGVPGELYVAGEGLARGYQGRPDMTAEKFVPDPFSQDPGARLYRTGDRVRWLAHGELEYLGRIDHQVKVRGFRIELGEVESVLLRHAGVREAAVVVREDAPGDKRLVAYVVAHAGAALDAAGLRRHLKDGMPEYMVPSAFVMLDALPMTPAGKVDRKALPAPTGALARPDAYVAPRTSTEVRVAALFSRVLTVERVGAEDSFFELGGHSLMATQLVSRLRGEFQVELPLRALFEAPTVAALAARVDEAASAEREFKTPPLKPAPRDGALPLSFDQERLWLFEQLTPGTPIYNVPSAARLSGDLEVEVLRRGLEEIVRRHEALRTVFRQDASGAPMQVVLPARPFVLPLVDLSTLPTEQVEAEARKRLNEEAARPFDLVQGPLLRAQILRLSAREHVLCLVQHHIVVDGWAVGVFMHELQALYTAFLRGEPSPLPALPVQYADYTLWHRQWLSGDVLEQQIAWWRQQLAGAPRIPLRTDAPRPAGDRFHGDSRRFHLSPDLTSRIEALGRGEGATLFMVLLAAFDALLHRRTGQDDIVVGTDIANRAREELESLVGFFTNQLVLRTQVTGDLSFRALLDRVRKGTLDAYEHQDLPFGTLVQALKPPREPGGQLFNVKFVLENAPLPPLQLPGLELSLLDAETNGTAKWDLLVVVFPWQGGLTVTVEHNTDVLDRASVERLFAHFESLLRAVVEDPERRIGALPLLTPDERHTLAAWNDRARTYPHGLPVSRVFESQVARAPDAVAVTFEGDSLTAAQLNARANQLAHHLRALGVRAGKRVGICLERSLDLAVAVLGIVKAGGAYVPLDPSFPTERLSLLIEDAGLSALVSVSALADELPAQWLQVVCLDDDAAALAKRPSADLDTAPGAEDELYVLYTSGSTGRPKGVSVPHRAVVRLVCGPEWVRLTPQDVFLQLAPLAFDASTFELWGALLNGAKLAVFPPRAPTLDELGQVIAREGVSTLWLTAGLFHQMVDGNLEGLRPVRQLLAGGDVLSPAHVLRVMEQLPGCRVINGYGPTENTTFTACYPVEGAGALGISVPIGRPINGTRVYVLNASLEPVPLGAPGELFAGGDGLAHGYLNQPELTAEKFIPDPFSQQPGSRLYRTGDQVRFRADGALEFLGRIDQQVKVRGFRIEPGEIETALRGHPSVADVTVAVQEVAGDKALVAYVVTEEGAEPLGVDTMRSFLQDKLPAYMVPAALMAMDALPLTPNGKVDRRALPVPGSERPQMATAYAAPRTAEETALCEVWADVLGVERVGIDDSFYDLGGDSIRSIQLIAKLRERGLDLPMVELLRQPTIRALGNLVHAAPAKDAARAVPGSEPFSLLSEADRARLPADVEDAYPVAVLQAGMLFQSELDQASGMYHDATSYHLEMALDAPKLHQLLGELARRHAILRTSFDLTGYEQPLQLVHREAQVPLELHDVRHVPAAEQDALLRKRVEEDRCRPFDWSRAPLLRFALYRRTEKTLQFSLIFHHAILDGWSLATLLSELFRGYVNLLRGTPVAEVAPLAVTYRQFVALEHQSLTSGEGEQFWRSRLAEVDRPAPRAPLPAGQEPVLSMRQLDVPLALQEGLQRVAQAAGVPLKTVLLAAHLRVRSLMEGRRSVVTGVVSNGRPETADSERMVGLFLNSIPFPVTLEDGSWLDLVRQVSRADGDIWPHRRYPMGRLQQQLGGQRLFDTIFNFVHFHVAGGLSQLEGVRLLEETPSTAWMELPLSTLFLQRPDTGALMLVLRTNGTQRDADQTEALAGYYFRALEAIAANPHARHEHARLLPDAERQKLLVEWNATGAAPAGDTCVHERFALHAARTPGAVAVVCDDGQLTYGELNRKANQLAHWLRARGVGPDARVGLLTERTPDAIVGVMGILKAGGAYVPLDPSHPPERLRTVLEDAAASLVVTQASLAGHVVDAAKGLVCLDSDAALLQREREEDPPRLGDAGSLAYVIFTSGSTGRPKGVAIEHRQLNHYVEGVTLRLELPPAASFASVSTLAADLGHTAVFPTLSGGGTLHLISRDRASDPAALGDYFERHAVDCLKIVPSHLTALLSSPSPERVLPRKRLVLGGEASDPALVARVHALVPGCEVFNHYGPTETTVGVLTWKVERGTALPATASVPLGRPLPNARMYVLDAAMQPVPVGVPGELFIGGAGVARGYLGQPGLTLERFLADPFHPEPGARVYRTGDRVRYLPDGALEFLGRVDFQVKVRGFRIELPEIEAAMSGLPGVAEVVVLAREDVPGDKRLVAYVVAVPGHTLEAGALRQGLKTRLPDYMVPSAFVTLGALPLTPNGKVDRRALPAPEQETEAGRAHVAPRTPTEELIAGLWLKLLGVERVGVKDDFFALGGHSLLATQMISRIRSAFRVELPLRALFEATTVETLAARVDDAVRQGFGLEAPAIVPLSREHTLPLSFAQQRLWFLDQLEPDSAFYNIAAPVLLDGALEVAPLEQAFTDLVRRHEVLRTTFRAEGGNPVQVVHAAAPMPLPLVDLTGLPEAEREAKAQRLADEDAGRPFNLATGPLLRATLVRLSDVRHMLLLTVHHIVSDGWSRGVLVREVAALYEAFRQGKPSPLPELPVQYADYSGWQRGWLQGDVLKKQVGYWKQQLSGAPSALELPTDFPRPAVQTYRGETLPFTLPRELSDALRALALKEGVTPYMLLLTAWQVLLARHAGQDDVTVGSPVAGRGRMETEGLIGFFINTLVLRTRLEGEPSFRQVLARVRESVLGAHAHQEVPFEKLVEELQPVRDTSRSPLFQVWFVLHQELAAKLSVPGLTLSAYEAEARTAKFDLALSMLDAAPGFVGRLEYNSDLFARATAERMMARLHVLLEGIVARPEAAVGELPLLSAEERHQVLVGWNSVRAELPREACIHSLIEAHAEATPDAVALVYEDTSLTYAELDAKANQLAHHLRRRYVGPEVRVALCLERSLDLVVAMLGILKAGGAFIPLDPSYPVERLDYMLSDSGAPVLLTQESLMDSLPTDGRLTLQLDLDWDTIERMPEEAPRSGVASRNLAYVIYTSGSTGRPKGTLLQHQGLVNTALRAAEAKRVGPGSRVLQYAASSFDASVWEIFSTLAAGATLVLAPRDRLLPDEPLRTLLKEQRITTATLTPSVLAQLSTEGLDGLRSVVSAGEALSVELARKWGAGRLMINAYGPTEATVCATLTEGGVNPERLTIGRPWANVQVYVLDAALRPVPVGVAGELYVAGVGLARGYQGRPDLTAEKFVPHPFSTDAGARLYRTGDRVRWLATGELEYLGRIDFQVKVRGFRIELGEVESVLLHHAEVREAAVVVREDSPGDKRLVAYIVAQEDSELDAAELRRHLKGEVPEYMVPSAFVVLEALPMTPAGKVDRKALPAPSDSRTERSEAEFAAPRTPTEELLATVWTEILGVERVGVRDNFFELGGHSLLATQVASRIREAFGVELPLRALFEAPTIADLAQRVDQSVRSEQGLQAPPIVPLPREGSLPLGLAQQRLWFLDQMEPDSAFYNIVLPVRLEGALDLGVLERTFTELVRRHESLRTTFHAQGDQPVQRIHAPTPASLQVVDLGGLPDAEREAEAKRLADAETNRGFRLATGPLLRALILRMSETEHVLLLSLHHIITDGWSMSLLVREIATLYAAFREGKPSPLPELPVQYADYAGWQRDWLRSDVMGKHVEYWRQQLSGAPSGLELPTDFPRPAVMTYSGGGVAVKVPQPLSQRLKALCREQGVTPFMFLLAAWQVLLARHAGQDDISVGSPAAGRGHSETEGIIGFFVNTLVLRAKLSGNPTFRDVLLQVRDTVLSAHVHQEVPFEKLVEELHPVRDTSRSPLFQAMFVLQAEELSGQVSVAGLTLKTYEAEARTAKFDMSLSLADAAEGFLGRLAYNSDLFSRATAERLVQHFVMMLEGIATDMGQRVMALPLMTEDEARQVLVVWNDTRVDFPREACIPSLIEAHARNTPDAVALVHEDTSLTFAQLDAKANQLAHHLLTRGVGPEVRVALCLDRSLDLVVGMLGVLKAGGAFVPLDPAYPIDRLDYMLEDSGATVLVTRGEPMPGLHAEGREGLHLDDVRDVLQALPTTAPTVAMTSANLAYVIYTSGSTGRPKGTLLQHQGLVNTALQAGRAHRYAPGIRVLQYAASSFDASVCEVFGTLVAGATLVLAPRDRLLPDEPLRALLKEQRINAVTLTPSVLAQLGTEGLEGLRTVISAGEALSVELARKWGAGRLMINAYGPTEATVCATLTEDGAKPDRLTIGKPWANVQVYVLDDALRPVPVGVAGELYVAGVGLARGYQGRPDLTAEKFIPNPFSTDPGMRLYRTGDRVRWQSTGELEYLGRIDFQVKVRGFRIELGEVESVLLHHAEVREAAVVVREDSPGDKRLVAYVVAQQAGPLDVVELRRHLRSEVPEYMVPSAFVVLEALPMTPAGKVDRKALPAPTGEVSRTRSFVAPRTPTEELLAALFAQLLGVERMGAEDHFFELGGHSLMATRLASRIREAFDVELPLRTLFEAPTVSDLARRVDALVAQGRGVRAPPLVALPRAERMPLSFAQQRLWFLNQLEPDSAFYNLPLPVRLEGTLDISALERAFTELVRRHESLRTTFPMREGQPAQVIQPATALSLPVVDLSGQPEDVREAEAQRQANEEAQRPFHLANGPLLRVKLLKLEAQRHVLLATMHHIVSDGWSMGVLVREMAALYEAFASGRAPSLPELPVQYADYAGWQRGWLQGDVLAQQMAYWKQQLSGAPAALELPTDRPRPAVQTYRGASVNLRVGKPVTDTLKALALQEGATPFMVLLAAWQVLLARYSGQDDVSVGTPIAGRGRTETEGLIGFFVNTLVLRTKLEGNPSFRALLAQVKETTLGAYAHQEVPFEKLVEELAPTRDTSRTPLFQVLLSFQNAPVPELEVKGLTLRAVPLEHRTAQFDLNMTLSEVDGELRGAMEYNSDLFDAGTAERMLEHLRVLLEGVASQPDVPVQRLPLLTDGERHQLLETWNDTRADFPREACIHQRFEAQVARTPDALAATFEGEHLTYRQLDAKANQLAHHLRRLGVGPEVKVALCLERSLEMVIAVLGVLKAGGAYVPLDPKYPLDRLSFMLEDTQVPVVLTQDSLADELPVTTQQLISLDGDWKRSISREREDAPVTAVTAGNLAYVIYTSGSTGRPKGVAIEHRGVSNYLTWCLSAYGLDSGAGAPVHSSLAFDLTVTSMLAPLVAGRGVVMVSEARGVEGLGDVLRDGTGFSLVKLTPSHLRLLSDLLGADAAAGRTGAFVIGGEALFAEELAFWRKHAPATRLINEYGPTETVVGCSVHVVAPEDAGSGAVRIGRPLPNTRMYVLDAHLQPVPVGVPGELYIGGVQVGRGYLGRPELTAEKFIPDAFDPDGGARLYRSGDLGRWRADGTLEYLGRVDHQVKVRGYRIELGEVESALMGAYGVREAVVVVREDVAGDKRLVAYVAGDVESLDRQGLREHVERTLPEYMVPSAFVVLEALPVTSNGKVDRKALPAPSEERAEADGFIAPRTPTEELLAGAWSELLRVDRVGSTDDFFELGGHSLLATQVLSRVRSIFRIDLQLRDVFNAPTVQKLSVLIDQALQAGAGTQAPAIVPLPREGRLPLSFAQQRLWFLHRLDASSPAYNVPMVLRLKGSLDVMALEQSFTELVRRHESLRTSFHLENGQATQVIHPAVSLPLAVVNLSDISEPERHDEARRLADEEAVRPFQLATGPLLRVKLLKLAEEEHILLLVMHHIVSDGWSMGVLVREMAASYEAFASGGTPSLPELPVQYADYAGWQRGWLQGEVLEKKLAYWKQQLSGAPAALELPTDRPRPAVQTSHGASVQVKVGRELTATLKALALQEGTTPFMVLLAAWQTLLARYSGQDDVSVGTPIAGRQRAETEGLIGFFVNTLVLRTKLDGDPTFRELLGRVRETTLGAYAHQEVPFEKLVEELAPTRDTSRTPLFQVSMTLQNAPEGAFSLTDLTLEGVEVEHRTAKFDLSLGLTETANGMEGGLEYNTDLFDAATAERLARHLGVLLEGVAADPDARLHQLPLLTPEDRRQVVAGWNDANAHFPVDACLHSLFEAQAARTPDAVAVTYAEQRLTYRELDARANQLAHHLRSLGVGPEVLVGLAVERSLELMVGLLAILKAGGAYLPMDPAYPRERLEFMVEDARVPVVLTQQHLLEVVPSGAAKRLCLDADAAAWASAPTTTPDSGVAPHHLAYVIYTSGSTGRPKGAQIEHAQVVRLFDGTKQWFDFGAKDVWTLFHSYAFDFSVWEMWGALLYGGKLVVVPYEVSRTPADFHALLKREGVTVLNQTPSAFRQLIQHEERTGDSEGLSLRTVVFGGEALEFGSLRPWYARHADTAPVLVNMYGITETTVHVTYRALKAADAEGGRGSEVGVPIPDLQVYVLDAHGQPVPPGVTGEMYVGGAGLGRGYLGRPELTAQRFLPDPFSARPGARLYRSGDLARWRPNGTLEYLGRADFQVKVRGFRIELGEIEAGLLSHPSVREAVVLVREDVPGDKRLVAYLVGAPGQGVAGSQELREQLRRTLPEYMVPSAFVPLEALPLTSNGKVDRRALPAPDTTRAEAAALVVARTPLQLQLVRVWEETLGVSPIGIRDDFFDLGGHSMLAVQLMGRIQQLTGRDLPLASLFQASTVEQLSALLEQEAKAWSPLVALKPEGTKPPLFCIHPAGGGVLCYVDLARELDADQPCYGLQARGTEGEEPLGTVAEMAALYLDSVREVQPHGPYHLAGWSLGGIIAFEMARQLRARGEEVALLASIDAYTVQHMVPDKTPEQVLEDMLTSELTMMLAATTGRDPTELRERISRMTQPERVAYFYEVGSQEDTQIADVGVDRVRNLYRVFESTSRAFTQYDAKPHDGTLVLLRASQRPDTREHHGWEALVTSGVEVVEMPGSHMTMMRKPLITNVAKELQARIGSQTAPVDDAKKKIG
ncbi:amino acid adenylation domain-containing protein, partial [Corallococcus sp. Z5C101001]